MRNRSRADDARPRRAQGLERHLSRRQGPDATLAAVDYLDMPVTAHVDDTFRAAQMMREAGVAASSCSAATARIARWCECGARCWSRGFPPAPATRSPRCAGQRPSRDSRPDVPPAIRTTDAIQRNKRLDIDIRDAHGNVRSDRIALVDAVIARALHRRAGIWKIDTLAAVYVSYTPIRRRSGSRPSRAFKTGRPSRTGRPRPSNSPRPARASSTCARRSRPA